MIRWLRRLGKLALFVGTSRQRTGVVFRNGRRWWASVRAWGRTFNFEMAPSLEAAKAWCLAMLDEGERLVELPRMLYTADGQAREVPHLEPLRSLFVRYETFRPLLLDGSIEPTAPIKVHEVTVEAKCFGISVREATEGLYMRIRQLAAFEPGAEHMEAEVLANLTRLAEMYRRNAALRSLR